MTMLTEKEMQVEIELLESKIEDYLTKLEPYTELENVLYAEASKLFPKSKFDNSIGINLSFSVKQKSVLENQIKRWEFELRIYKRILEGKKMDALT